MSQTFKKRIEDFTCEQCGGSVKGNGYTNHCPNCLWSKHVDINPGDRQETCCGMMKPASVEREGDSYRISHVCSRCGVARNNKISKDDNFDAIVAVNKLL